MLPLSTTRIKVESPSESEPYEGTTYTVTAQEADAHLSVPTGREELAGGDKEVVTETVLTEATIGQGYRVTDLADSTVYRVAWACKRHGLGLSHYQGGLVRVTGLVPGG